MPTTFRGADIVARTLERAGHTDIFTLSGNHIMSIFDAALDTRTGSRSRHTPGWREANVERWRKFEWA